MGRKSLAEERTNQILDAFEHCILTFGFEGATLQRTADQADLNLGMIHHYIGRKTDLLEAMVTRLLGRIEAEMAEFDRFIPDHKRLPTLLSEFFGEKADPSDRLIEALISTGHDHSAVHAALDRINRLYASIWAAEVGRMHPSLTDERCNEIALSILGLAYGRGFLPDSETGRSLWRIAAETLIHNP